MIESTLDDIIGLFKISYKWNEGAKELSQLVKNGLSLEDGLKAIEAAGTISFPAHRIESFDSQARLINAAKSRPDSQYIQPLVQYFANFTPYAKFWAHNLLASIPTRDATQAWLNVIRQFAHDSTFKDIAIEPFRREPRDADILFPALMEWTSIERFRFKIYYLCLTYSQANLLSPNTLAPYSAKLLEHYKGYKTRLLRLQPQAPTTKEESEEVFNEKRYVKLLLDAMAHFPSPEITAELWQMLGSKDIQLRYFAATSLLTKSEAVSPQIIHELAATAEMRNWLYERLKKLKKLDLYPQEFYSQAAFAESSMVEWLMYPSELGFPPDEIELMKVVSIDTQTPTGIIDYYVFRFRMFAQKNAPENKWMAGVAGFYVRNKGITNITPSRTFSSFDDYDSATPEEHVGDIQEILDDWRKYHFRE